MLTREITLHHLAGIQAEKLRLRQRLCVEKVRLLSGHVIQKPAGKGSVPESGAQIFPAAARDDVRSFVEVKHFHGNIAVILNLPQCRGNWPEINLTKPWPLQVRIIRVEMGKHSGRLPDYLGDRSGFGRHRLHIKDDSERTAVERRNETTRVRRGVDEIRFRRREGFKTEHRSAIFRLSDHVAKNLCRPIPRLRR
jgi:hypothetical protein